MADRAAVQQRARVPELVSPRWYRASLAAVVRRRNLWMVVAVFSTGCNLLLAVFLVSREVRERVIVVPPRLERAFWMQGGAVSASYLEQVAVFAVELALTYSPENTHYRIQQLLRLSDPAVYGKLSRKLHAEAERVKRTRTAAVFHPQEARVRTAERKVLVTGMHQRMTGGKVLDSRQLVLVVEFSSGDRPLVLALWEVDPHALDPFSAPAAELT